MLLLTATQPIQKHEQKTLKKIIRPFAILLYSIAHQFLGVLSFGNSHNGSRSNASTSWHHRDTTSCTTSEYRRHTESSPVLPLSSTANLRSLLRLKPPLPPPALGHLRASPGLENCLSASVGNASGCPLPLLLGSESAVRRWHLKKVRVAALQKPCRV